MSTINVKIEKCTKGKSENFVITLKEKGEKVQVLPGVYKEKVGLTYYMSLSNPLKEGDEYPLNLDLFIIKEQPYQVVDRTTGELVTLMLKWLWLK